MAKGLLHEAKEESRKLGMPRDWVLEDNLCSGATNAAGRRLVASRGGWRRELVVGKELNWEEPFRVGVGMA